MILNDRIVAFTALGAFLNQFKPSGNKLNNAIMHNDSFYEIMQNKIVTAKHHNGWFTEENVLYAIEQWAKALTEENLKQWLDTYDLSQVQTKTVGVVMAGNIPLVGFHDVLCVLIAGHKIQIKQSSNDQQLLPLLLEYLITVEPRFKEYISFTKDKLADFDAVIATGSNNTARYFEYYFSKKPNIIRKNRNSVAVLTGEETSEELSALGEDIFRYYGLGCRSVSKLLIPQDYDFDTFFKAMYPYSGIIDGDKYANNYDYNKAVYLMSNFKLLENGFLVLKEDQSYASPIASLFYEKYDTISDLEEQLKEDKEQIQCIVSNGVIEDSVTFGKTQQPELWDYADGVDIIQFLIQIGGINYDFDTKKV